MHSSSVDEWLGTWDVRGGAPSPEAVELFHAAPGGVRTTEPFSTMNRWDRLDTDAAGGCIRDRDHAYSKDGGLAILFGNIAPEEVLPLETLRLGLRSDTLGIGTRG